jgi:hypothetical protein
MPLIRLFLDICLFKKGPQDIPNSSILLRLVMLAYWTMGLVLLSLQMAWFDALLRAGVEALILFGFLWTALILLKKSPRLRQTATAVYATDTLISGCTIPLLAWLLIAPEEKGISLLMFFLILWQVAVLGHILRYALTIPLSLGIGLAFVYMVANYQIMRALFDWTT